MSHAVSPEGRRAARDKLADLPAAFVPHAKPGWPLAREILARARPETRIDVLENHGLIVCGADVSAAEALMEEVETRPTMPARHPEASTPATSPPDGFDWTEKSWIARDTRAASLARAGSYYPDHVVFLGPALPVADHDGTPPAILIEGAGIAQRRNASASQRAMLRCLSDLLLRLPADWTPEAIGTQAKAELLDWDAEKYLQARAARALTACRSDSTSGPRACGLPWST